MRGIVGGDPVITSHPDHVASLFKAKPELAPSLTAESPLRPIVGPNSVLTANGPRHLRQRKLLLPPFHGEAIERYAEMIADVAEREIDRWQVGRQFALAPRMQAITLDVIMAGIFGIEGRPARGTPEHRLRDAIKYLAEASTWPLAKLGELMNVGRDEPVGILKRGVGDPRLGRRTRLIAERRRDDGPRGARRDIMSLLMRARDRGRRAAHRPGAARRAADPRARRASRRPPTRSPGRGSGSSATPPPTTGCATRSAPATRRRGAHRGRDHRGHALAARDPDDRASRRPCRGGSASTPSRRTRRSR